MNINVISSTNTGICVESKDLLINDKIIASPNNSEVDTYEHSVEGQGIQPCENYNNMRTYSKMKVITDKIKIAYSDQITELAESTMEQYYNGDITEEELKNSYETCCNLYFDMLRELGEDPNTEESKKRAVMRAFTSFQNENCTCSMFECDKIGKRLASQYGYTEEQNIDYLYYDADSYYKNEKIRETLTDIVQSMFSDYELNDLNAEKEIAKLEKSKPVYGGLTFNSRWAASAKYGANIGNLTSITEAPPEGFRFFYKVNQTSSIADATGAITLDSQKGIMIIWDGNKKQAIDVPFNGSTSLGELAEIFNAADLYGKTEDCNPRVLEYLQHFNIYTRTYSFIHLLI